MRSLSKASGIEGVNQLRPASSDACPVSFARANPQVKHLFGVSDPFSLADVLREHVEQFDPAEDGRIFITNGHKGLLDWGQFGKKIKDAAERAGIDTNAHQLRHF